MSKMEKIQGAVVNVRGPYRNRWAVLSIEGGHTVTGTVPRDLQSGDYCEFEGNWQKHPVYGDQFAAKTIRIAVPKNEQGKLLYLQRILPGVGRKTAKKLIETFGGLDNIFETIEHTPQALLEINGLTLLKINKIREAWLNKKTEREFDEFCAANHITPRMQERLLETYQTSEQVMKQLKINPYVLTDEMYGVGFKRADALAGYLGIHKDMPMRIRMGVLYTLQEASHNGHCFLTQEELREQANKLLQINKTLIDEQIKILAYGNAIVVDDQSRYYLPRVFKAEQYISRKIATLLSAPLQTTIQDISPDEYALLDDDQRKALEYAISEKVLVITGGPGVGKTYTLNTIIRCLPETEVVALAAPTGKAAKRMHEATGKEAKTIHRLLEYSFAEGGFIRNEAFPLTCNVLIIDEASMIDVLLMDALLKAVPDTGCRLILVGDKDQLPSVGPGKVFGDIIKSGEVPTVELKTLHRQAEKSLINVNAQRINRGRKLTFVSDAEPDMWFLEQGDATKIPHEIVRVCKKIPERFPFHITDIQVLCPQKIGDIGTQKLNLLLRDKVFNPDGTSITGTSFRVRDRVIQLRNNYDLGVFNGDIGTIVHADSQYLYVNFEYAAEGKDYLEVKYPIRLIDDLSLAYALTIHKSQGSEFPVVIMPIHTNNFIMLKRNLFYTGITRGRQMVVLVGTNKAINIAIRTVDGAQRNTTLAENIKNVRRQHGNRGCPGPDEILPQLR